MALIGLAATQTAANAAAPAASAAQQAILRQHLVKTANWRRILWTKPPRVEGALHALHAHPTTGAGRTVPYWTTTITSPLDGNTYQASMVGSSPYEVRPHNTNIAYVPIVVRIHLGGFVLDPTVPGLCDTQSPAYRFFNSPLFRPTTFISNGVNVSNVKGGAQLISAFQRANFWKAAKGTDFGVTFVPSRSTPIVVDWYPSNPSDGVVGVPSDCSPALVPAPLVEINEFDAELQAIAAAYAKPSQVPVTLAVDTAIYVGVTSQCCVLGYHNAIPVFGGTQLYAVGAYFDTNQAFGPHFADITVWAHELGELVDDPFVQSIPTVPGGDNNGLTPSWGHTGQVYGCQNNLEVGDPLTPDQEGDFVNYAIPGYGGFTYHTQDLAFHDWFYRTASSSTGGKGSFIGNFGAGQPTLC